MLKNVSIKYKITIITLLVSMVTLFAAMSVLFVFDLFNKEEEMRAQLEQKARQIHEKNKDFVRYNTFSRVKRNVRAAMIGQPNITTVAIYDSAGQLFFEYRRDATR